MKQNKTNTMKTMHINKTLLLLLALVVFNSCVQDDDFETPNTSVVDPNIPESDILTIDAIFGDYLQAVNDDENSVTYDFFDNGVTKYIEGYVVSNDEAGNYFEELIIQDKPENPTRGIRILIDVNPLFVRYEVGRKVFVKLNGLTAAIGNGVFSLGELEGDQLEKISSAVEGETIVRDVEVATIVPKVLSFSEFNDDNTNLFIKLENVQFERSQINQANPLTYASEPGDDFDGERILESCDESSSIILSTSTFSDFKGLQLPVNRGSITGVLTKNFFGDVFNLAINSPEDVNFDMSDRCDPDFLECTGPSGGGAILFEEDFEGFAGYTTEGWDNINIDGTSTDWFISGFGGNNYSRISAFNSGNVNANVWLVTPPVDLTSTTGEELSFDIQANFDNGTNLSVWVSTDYAGDPTTATWSILDASIPIGPSGGFGNFETVGPINISCVEGNAVFGFFYEGSDPSATTRYHVDNIEVTGN